MEYLGVCARLSSDKYPNILGADRKIRGACDELTSLKCFGARGTNVSNG